MKYDWENVYMFFLRSGATLKQVSSLLDIPYQSIRRRAGRDKWLSDQWILKRAWEEGKETPVYPFTPEELVQFFREWKCHKT